MEKSLFEQYGGFARISKVVLEFYERLLDDDDLAPFFEHIDMARIVDHQTKFITTLLGGPASYSDEQLRHAHKHLVIADAHFDRLKAVLGETLADFGFGAEHVEFVLGEFERKRGLMVR